ncbi:MAG: hypothetical protein M3405_16490 [Acidobacteriota bacterium]|jgi:hypothetical protein|nr:hypothetical protein [Acidobacteriota bacterium]
MSETKNKLKQYLIYVECLIGLPTNQTYTIFKIENNIFDEQYFLSEDEAKSELLPTGKLFKLEGNKCNAASTYSSFIAEALRENQANFLIFTKKEMPVRSRRKLLESCRLSRLPKREFSAINELKQGY